MRSRDGVVRSFSLRGPEIPAPIQEPDPPTGAPDSQPPVPTSAAV
eukprot:CAMPEP_0184860556 /NCGR_PEP_ID=MMETSP0580-20130426/5426_1 /TAXON_ID=1118495 /ORGANISM="Dactyliosolen fragilissimus" /LENGTH=44 /DNA_ID= /DNA_START= /DNA_END= /DNA_ORIENTATION=